MLWFDHDHIIVDTTTPLSFGKYDALCFGCSMMNYSWPLFFFLLLLAVMMIIVPI